MSGPTGNRAISLIKYQLAVLCTFTVCTFRATYFIGVFRFLLIAVKLKLFSLSYYVTERLSYEFEETVQNGLETVFQ